MSDSARNLFLPHRDNHDVFACPTEAALLSGWGDSEKYPPYHLAAKHSWGDVRYNLWLPRCQWAGGRNHFRAGEILFEDVFGDCLIRRGDVAQFVYDVWGLRQDDIPTATWHALCSGSTVIAARLRQWDFCSALLIKQYLPSIPTCPWCALSREVWGLKGNHVVAVFPNENRGGVTAQRACSKICARKLTARGNLARVKYLKRREEWKTAKSKLREVQMLLRRPSRLRSPFVESVPPTTLPR